LPQTELASLQTCKAIGRGGSTNPFLQDEERLIELLSENGRGGFQLYALNICFGEQRTGGCFFFKQHASKRKREQLVSALGVSDLPPDALTVPQLKEKLRKLYRPVSGAKAELIIRLQQALQEVRVQLAEADADEKEAMELEERQKAAAAATSEEEDSADELEAMEDARESQTPSPPLAEERSADAAAPGDAATANLPSPMDME
jgi:hypothetical protein